MPTPAIIAMKRGIPLKSAFDFNQNVLNTIENLAGLGLPQVQIASIIGCSDTLLSEKINKSPDVRHAFEKGKALKHLEYSKKLDEKALIEGDTKAITFFLERKAGWRDETPGINVTVVPIFATQYQDAEKEFLDGNGRLEQGREGTIESDSGISEETEEGQVERDGNQAEDE